MSSKNRWLISLAAVAFVVTVSAVIICNNRVFPSGSSGRPGVVAVNDSSAGVIIAWHENNTIYAQHIDGSGKTQWGETGLFITECPGSGLTLLSDGSGGAIVSWYDESFRPDDRDDPGYYGPAPFYCRRITPDGRLIWNDEPVSEGRERYIVPDGSGGAIIAWDNYTVKYRGLWDNSLRIQKIAPDGSMPWGDEGILVVASSPFRTVTDEDKTAGIKGTYTRSFPTYSGYHLIAGDDEGGIYVAWAEENLTSKGSIYLQRISSNGTFSWDDRVHVADKNLNSLSTDGQGGVIITGIDPDNSIVPVNNRKIRIDREGNIVESGIFDPADIGISDGTGGSFSIRVEEDPPYGDPRERRYIPWITRLDPSGQALWEEVRGLPDDSRHYSYFNYIPDGSGGVIVTWVLEKASGVYADVRARKLDAGGNVRWNEQGVPVYDIPGIEYQKTDTALGDRSGGVIVVGILGTSPLRGDTVYAQRLGSDGNPLWKGGVRVDR